MRLKDVLLIFLWVTHGPIIRMAGNPRNKSGPGLFYRALIPVVLIYFTALALTIEGLISLLFNVDLSRVTSNTFLPFIVVLGAIVELYILRDENIKKMTHQASKSDLINEVSKKCTADGYTYLWWFLIFFFASVMFFSAVQGII